MALEQFKQIARVLFEFGSGFDQADVSLAFNQELGFVRAERINSTVLFSLLWDMN